MSATIIQFPERRREHVEVEKRIDVTGRSTWHFVVIATDGRRVPVGVRDDARDALADMLWFRHGGMRVIPPTDFEVDVTNAISEHFARGLVDELRINGNMTLRPRLDDLRLRCTAVMIDLLGRPNTDPIEVPIALSAISMAMAVRDIVGAHQLEADVANAELIVGRIAQQHLERLFAQAGGAA